LDQAIKQKNSGDLAGALGTLSAIVGEYPGCAPAFGLMGGVYYFELGKWKEAVSCYQQAVRLSPRSEAASLGLFHSLWDSGLREKAIVEMNRFQSVSYSADYDEIATELKREGLMP
jgi:tetratricopeptide (TPR) repeat protein